MDLMKEVKKELAAKGVKNEINNETVIKTLGIDSLDLMDMVTNLEEKLNIRLDDDTLMSIKTIGDLVDAVNEAKSA